MKNRNLTFAEAINEAQIQAMKIDPNVFIFGQGVDKTALVFKTTNNILKKFGKKRIFDTPNAEQAETALAAGAANSGLRPILIHHRVDFMAYTFDQICLWLLDQLLEKVGVKDLNTQKPYILCLLVCQD